MKTIESIVEGFRNMDREMNGLNFRDFSEWNRHVEKKEDEFLLQALKEHEQAVRDECYKKVWECELEHNDAQHGSTTSDAYIRALEALTKQE